MPGPRASARPTPRELRALMAVADGCSLAAGAHRLGRTVGWLAHVLSRLYTRFGIKELPGHRLSHDRRYMAVRICKANGWWPDDAHNPYARYYREH